MGRYRKRPVVIEAEQFHFDRTPWPEGVKPRPDEGDHRYKSTAMIETLEGTMFVSDGDWIITGVRNERYPCKDEIFRATYDPVGEWE